MDVKWYLGFPLNDTSNLRPVIAEYGERILGNNLLGLQVGNEPDLYDRYVSKTSEDSGSPELMAGMAFARRAMHPLTTSENSA